ncbi:MAG: hypothetical protein UW68_C0046G0013 [Candidatus Collierbacteria bacterium GW2011_GWB1_44_6]|uniref:Uncharacterized protein n=2 Tax=Candidatus Collieribacteriota TaxID=1752725 RepID=A0A0G1JLD4_9BACT|nr:MAG: hypothetical protein UV68_C0053G0004 [Candidatus Collierbacteria bacterium GW2011_GWC2_43_12]KKT72165.1 MAG: hypothetical protein UW68_C0046G0013 [Candidatus Collierbacteria bacterium GW2011_GWB1_44_6]
MSDPQYNKDDTAKNEMLLEQSKPKSGRLIKENNTVINITEAIIEDEEGNLSIRAHSV